MLRTLYHRVFGDRIFAGPFRGLHYAAASVGSVHLAKLAGICARELWPQVERLLQLEPDVIVNIGAAEGAEREILDPAPDEQRPGPMRWFWLEPRSA